MKRRAPRRGTLASDSLGQVSFSIIAVVLLVATAATGTYLAKSELQQRDAEQKEKLLDAMENVIDEAVQELSLAAASRAHDTVSGWDSFPINESEISSAFSAQMSRYISSSFPRAQGKFSVDISNWTGGLFFLERKTLDLVPAGSAGTDKIQIEDESMEYHKLPAPSVEVLDETTASPYYVAIGNFTAKSATKEIELAQERSFQRPILSALPFLESKLREFESASEGECADLGKLVGYMLSTLGQLRVLEGYGQPMYSGCDTSSIIAEEDVYKAVAVGLLLEQARLFRNVDREFAQAVANICDPNAPGLIALLGSRGRSLDPAELFLWFIGKTQLSIDARMIVAEAVYGVTDQLTLRLMDYMGWIGAFEAAKDVADAMSNTLESIISFFTGEDKAKLAVTTWVSRTLSKTGVDPGLYSNLFTPEIDYYVSIPEKLYYVQDAGGDLYPVWVGNTSAPVDVPAYDLLSSDEWRDFYPMFKAGQSRFRDLAEDSVMRLAFDIAECAQITGAASAPDPTDDVDIFETLAFDGGRVSLNLDSAAIDKVGRQLPMFSAQFELSSEFREFVNSRSTSLVNFSSLLDAVYEGITESVLASARHSYIANIVVPVEQQLREIVRTDVEHDSAWGIGECASSILDSIARAQLARLIALVNRSVTRSEDGFSGPLVDSVAKMMAFGSDTFPGVRQLLELSLSNCAKQVLSQAKFSGHKRSVYLDLGSRFEFWEGDLDAARGSGRSMKESINVSVPGGLPPMLAVPYDAAVGYSSLESMFPTDNMLVQVKRPWQYDRSREEYPNVHMTALSNATVVPYTTQWTVSVVGLVGLNASSDNSALRSVFSDGTVESHRSVKIELCFPVVLHSAWPLQGVEYNPTNTALSDGIDAAMKFSRIVWEKIEPYVGWIKDCLERLYRFVERVFDVITSFATRVVKAVSEALETVVETLQAYVQKIADSALARAVKMFIDMTGRAEFRISVMGFVIIVQTSVPDLLYKHGNDMLRIMVYTDRLGPGITFGVRIARLSDGSYDVLANGTITTKRARMDVAVDPLMHIMRRLVEAHCAASSWALDIAIPEVEPYELSEVSTSDIPGIGAFLSDIPLPALGLSASIEAGLKLKYSSPFPSDVVVNEFESNPQGEDAGKEWVELYNPLGKPKCIDGWKLGTVHGKNNALDLTGTIPPNGILAFTFPDVSIDNGYANDPFNDGDAVMLIDPSGATVDITPMLRDTANDGRTNQRAWDGGPRWVFKQGTRDNSNGVPVLLASSDFIAKALFEAFMEAFMETKLQEVTASLDFIILFAKRVLNNFIENLLSLVKEIVHEVIFYLEVTLNDASGAAGGGFRASFVVTGQALMDLLRWLIHTLATFVVNLGRPSCPITYPAFPQEFFAGLYFRFEVLFRVGLPKMMEAIGTMPQLDVEYACVVSISPNIPAIGKLVGRQWGNWSVDFGMYLEGVPKDFAASYLAKDTGDLIDFWIVKARLYGI